MRRPTPYPRLERCTNLFAELVGKSDEHSPVALPLVGRESQDARQVVPEVGVLLLAEVSHGVEPEVVPLEHERSESHNKK